MSHRSTVLVVLIVLIGVCASSLFTGCGSADTGEYEREVTELVEAANEALAEVSLLLAEGEPETEQERVEAAVAALEEALVALEETATALEQVKVPEGMEDLHRALVTSYHNEVAFYAGLAVTLKPGREHAEGEGGGQTDEEEAPQEEGTPAGGSGH